MKARGYRRVIRCPKNQASPPHSLCPRITVGISGSHEVPSAGPRRYPVKGLETSTEQRLGPEKNLCSTDRLFSPVITRGAMIERSPVAADDPFLTSYHARRDDRALAR